MPLTDFSYRATELSPSKIRDVAELGMGDPDVIPLWFGEAAWRSPMLAIDAAKTSLDTDPTPYQPNSGLPALREAVSAYLNQLHGVALGTERVTISASGMQGLTLAAQTLVAPGDRVVMIAPDWPNIAAAFAIAGGRVEKVALGVQNGRWTLDLRATENLHRQQPELAPPLPSASICPGTSATARTRESSSAVAACLP